jgi:WD40 repeat protein
VGNGSLKLFFLLFTFSLFLFLSQSLMSIHITDPHSHFVFLLFFQIKSICKFFVRILNSLNSFQLNDLSTLMVGNRLIKIWSRTSGTLLKKLTGHPEAILDLDWSISFHFPHAHIHCCSQQIFEQTER